MRPCEGLGIKAEGFLAHGRSCGRRRNPFPGLVQEVPAGGPVCEIGMLPGVVLVVVEFPFPGRVVNGPVA